MSDVVDRLFALWRETPADDEAALAGFRALYADPVPVNGVPMTAAELLARARALSAAFDRLEVEVVDEFEAPDRLVVVHRMSGRHTGPLPTPLGALAPTGEVIEALTIDVLVVENGRITSLWVTSDDLARLVKLNALQLVQRS
jgi:ketosteroid isomerase-like protein